ncbi:TPA: hypothetical protein DIV55_05655 [Patescibacteria group bacterium]|nr:hypothetical protein [Patescibacteria group bacterium]
MVVGRGVFDGNGVLLGTGLGVLVQSTQRVGGGPVGVIKLSKVAFCCWTACPPSCPRTSGRPVLATKAAAIVHAPHANTKTTMRITVRILMI